MIDTLQRSKRAMKTSEFEAHLDFTLEFFLTCNGKLTAKFESKIYFMLKSEQYQKREELTKFRSDNKRETMLKEGIQGFLKEMD